MRIMMPVDNDKDNVNIYNFFGRAPYFFIYDLDYEKYEFLKNHASNAIGGTGIIDDSQGV